MSSAVLKVWLPQVLVDRINWLSKHQDSSRPDVMRALLFQHIYGHVAYLALCDHQKKLGQITHAVAAANGEASIRVDAFLHGMGGDITRSTRRETPGDLEWVGRSDEDLTITLPTKLKKDVVQIAKLHGLTPSSYVRKLLVQMLMGEEAHSRWQYEIGKLSPDIERLERD